MTGASPIHRTRASDVAECCEKMHCVGAVGALDAEIIDHEGKEQVACGVFPESMGDLAWCASMWLEEFDQSVTGDASSLGETMHATSDFDANVGVNE